MHRIYVFDEIRGKIVPLNHWRFGTIINMSHEKLQ
jgi:hypothetical protein